RASLRGCSRPLEAQFAFIEILELAMKYLLTILTCMILTSAVGFAANAADVQVDKAWSRATAKGAAVGAGYMTITNKGASADRLVSASSPAAGKVEVHTMAMNNGVMTMRPATGGVSVDAGKSVSLSPGGLHLMLMQLKAPLKQGDKVPVTLQFEKAGK